MSCEYVLYNKKKQKTKKKNYKTLNDKVIPLLNAYMLAVE